MAGQVAKRLLTVSEYYRMAEAGIFSENERVELIEGELVTMSPIGSPHAACVMRLNALLSAKVGQTAIVNVQNPIHLSDYSEPEPDLSLLKPRADFYAERHPTPEDVLLVIEVADTSLAYDQTVKVPLYARAGIPEMWLLDLTQDVITVNTQTASGQYQQSRQVRRGDSITLSAIPGVVLHVDEILGR
jgi:Uma2 family endonuclease